MISALVTIVAQVVALLSEALNQFVTVTPSYQIPGTCNFTNVTANVQCLGDNLALNLAGAIQAVVALVPNLLGGLGAVVI